MCIQTVDAGPEELREQCVDRRDVLRPHVAVVEAGARRRRVARLVPDTTTLYIHLCPSYLNLIPLARTPEGIVNILSENLTVDFVLMGLLLDVLKNLQYNFGLILSVLQVLNYFFLITFNLFNKVIKGP